MAREHTVQYLISSISATLFAAVVLFVSSASVADVVDIEAFAADRIGELEQHIGDRDVIFYAIDLETVDSFAYQPERVDERHTPYSTFKIPNLLIALETDVATSLGHERDWNEQVRPAASYWPDDWKQTQTLESAFKRSAMWYFQDVAVEVGGERYRRILRSFGYGNGEAPDSNDTFWLEGPLAISAKEQALFLEKLVTANLNVSHGTLEAIREASFLGDIYEHRIYGKTGSGPVMPNDFDGEFEGWLVGWVNRPTAAPVVYALYVRGPSYSSIASFRGEMTMRFLRTIGTIPDA